jgi:hypothetical protein
VVTTTGERDSLLEQRMVADRQRDEMEVVLRQSVAASSCLFFFFLIFFICLLFVASCFLLALLQPNHGQHSAV